MPDGKRNRPGDRGEGMPFYNWSQMPGGVISPHYSTAAGPTVKGAKIEVGCYRYPPGTGAKPHRHPQEQVINVRAGKLRVRVGAEEQILVPGEVVRTPPNTQHQA